MKFKIGDKVKIRSNIREYVEGKCVLDLEECDFVPGMEKDKKYTLKDLGI